MSIAKPVIYDGAQQRQLAAGDIVAGSEAVPATNTGTAVTLTGQLLALGNYLGNPGSASTLTLDTAANIVSALTPVGGSIQNGTTFRFRVIQTTAFTATLAATANTGVTVNRGVVAASSAKEFLVTVTNGTPAATITGMTTNASNKVTGLSTAQIALINVGMIVTNAINNLQGTTVTSVDNSAGSFTLSGNANATSATPVAINLSPTIVVDGLAP